ncbi:molybdopterin-dependent oxidoreductase [Hoeflea sp. WL0058]|uniref:Molybdopterin-dependent oxidoreductase n=1 Tax=Flavimaribacter sediminis TaxID=2865987 RepID=A0AAE3D2S4_9HYPH|nr:molybdopterin cofactor-binding domain-containing protein [Flavimaribacter sediminis]MBW8638873.1 molybdopterin-dependent oxidoreductase [Flavimaribacter sediminis]
MRVVHPDSLTEAQEIARDAGGTACFVAGATALQLLWANGGAKPDILIDLGGIAKSRGVVAEGGDIRIGALTTLSDVASDEGLQTGAPLLAHAIGSVAGPAVRNLATIGGNIANRNGCLLPVLLALEARLVVFRSGAMREIALAEWLGETATATDIVCSVNVTAPGEGAVWIHRKVGLRRVFTPSVVAVAGVVHFDSSRLGECRIAVGGGVVTPSRLVSAEKALQGRSIESCDWASVSETIMREVEAPDDLFRSGAYRRKAAAGTIVHALKAKLDGVADYVHADPAPPTLASGEIALGKQMLPDRWFTRPDMPEKVDATLSYLTDVREDGMLVGRILRAGVPHARLLSIDVSAAEALPGVAAVVTHRDIRGENGFGIVFQDQPALCHDKVRYAGDPVAAVAAVDAATAEAALGLIRVAYEPLPLVDDPEIALEPQSEAVHDSGNLQTELHLDRGDVDAGFLEAAHVVEEIYEMPRQMHGFLETEGGYARLEADGTLHVAAGGQHNYRDRMQLSRILGLPEERIRVTSSPTGGAFGGKDELTVQPALALLALKSGKAVRLHLDRPESVLAGTKRNPMRLRMRTGCDKDGRLVAQEVDLVSDSGAYASLSPGVLETALEHAAGPYVIDNIRTRGRLAYTNNGVGGAFRGFGANQMTFAVECQMDRLAALCGLSPNDIRRRNLRTPGMPGFLGQRVSLTERCDEMLEAAMTSRLWSCERGLSPDGADYVGVGMALSYQGNGLGTIPHDEGGGVLRLAEDGRIEALLGLDELGQGLHAATVSQVADFVGCARDDVRPITGDTLLAPDSGSTTASRGSYVLWNTARRTAPEFVRRMIAAAGLRLGREPEDLCLVAGGIADRRSNSGDLLISYVDLAAALDPDERPSVSTHFAFPKTEHDRGNARYIFAFGATIARVAVSRATGEARVLDLDLHSAAGPVIDVASYLGQMEGGAIQGLGFTLLEDSLMRDGAYLTTNLDTYMMPGVADTAERLSVFAQESLDEGDDLGPRGVGELGIASVTPAIVNAVGDAIGYWPSRSPLSAEALLDHMETMQ